MTHPHKLLPMGNHLSDLEGAPITSSPLPGCVILLNGPPGVGKFTIARAIASQIPVHLSRVLNFHLLIDTALAIEPISLNPPAYHELRNKIKETAFNALKQAADRNLVIIMTTTLSTHPEDTLLFIEYANVARARSVPLFSFNIICNERVNVERLCSEERIHVYERERSMLVDKDKLLNMREHSTLFNPEGAVMPGLRGTIYHGVVDTSDFSAKEAAAKIVELCFLPLASYSFLG